MGLGTVDRIIIGAGYADLRKGFDLFLQLWRKMQGAVHCVWLGDIDPSLKNNLHVELNGALSSGTFHMPGRVDNVPAWLAAADVFALTSREDPYPSVVLEALAAGLPCVAFEETGGIPDLLQQITSETDHRNSIVPLRIYPRWRTRQTNWRHGPQNARAANDRKLLARLHNASASDIMPRNF